MKGWIGASFVYGALFVLTGDGFSLVACLACGHYAATLK